METINIPKNLIYTLRYELKENEKYKKHGLKVEGVVEELIRQFLDGKIDINQE